LTPAELFEAALKAVEGDEYALARRLGLSLSTAPRQFARWRRGEGMRFETTIALLEIAGLLRERPER
jgi:hypothetical protein